MFLYEAKPPFYTSQEYPVKAFGDNGGKATVDPGAVRFFVTEIKKFTQTLGKKVLYSGRDFTGGI